MSSSSSSSSSSRATGSSSSAGGSGVPTATVPGASYDQLLWQVELLKMENSTLRQELQHNSSHLCKLETEASNMKEVLKQLQGTIEEETSDIPTQLDFMERMKEMSMEPASLVPVKLRANKPAAPPAAAAAAAAAAPPLSQGPHGASYPKRGAPPPPAALSPPGDASQTPAGYLEQLQHDRSLLLAELDKEEKEKEWYYGQLQNLTMRIDSLPLSDNFSLQTDMTRRQLEFEARQLRGAMEEQLGSCQDMERRALARLSRIQHIEKDLLRGGQRLLHTEDKTEGVQMCADSSNAATNPQVCEQDSTSEASSTGGYSIPRRLTSHLGTKVEMVYSLLSMLGTHDKDDMSRTLLAMSSSQDSCIAMRQSGCLPLLIQLLHGSDKDSLLLGNSRGSKEARARASAALHNIVHSRPDDKRARREARVLHLLEQVRVYCEACWTWQEEHQAGTQPDKNPVPSPGEHQICPAVCVLMKLSFDEEHRHAMNELGGLQAIAELLQADCELYGLTADHQSITLRRYAGMALTNLTFGDVGNKATLCSMKGCMRAMVAQLKSDSEDLQQVVASVLRNLSWRADASSKKTLREVGSVAALMSCGLHVQKESTLKSVLSALWNLSAHCSDNKAELCAVGGALGFLARALAQRGPASAALAVVESAGGILRNVSSLVATNQAYRQVLRDNGCLATLLQHLRSPSLTVVSNACGTLWNLSARDPRDQEALWEMGAVAMLRNLVHSRHKMIAMGSAAALRNLLANRPAKYSSPASTVGGAGPGGEVTATPSLHARKHKALIEELDAQRQQLSETFDGLENLGPAHHPRRHRQPSPSATQHHHLQQRGPGVRRHKGDEEGGARSPYANTPVLSSPRAPPRPPALAWPAASSDSLHSVGSADGYGATEDERLLEDARLLASRQEEEEDEEEEEEEEAAYRRYPADLAHKIHSANSMADAADAELDTPINYSLKYSDEQLHSGRQSPAPAAAQSRGREREKEEEEVEEVGGRQEDRRRPYQAPYRAGSRADGQNPRTPHRNDGDDFGEAERPGHRHEQEPIDYSIKYGGHASPGRAASSSASSCKSNASGQKPLPSKAPGGGVNQDTPLTYCVEDTPICFSRGSSLSSLSSGDEDDERRSGRRRAGGRGHAHYPTLPVGQKEERDDSPAIAMTTGPPDGLSPDAPGQRQYTRMPRPQQHHHGNQQLHHHHNNHHHHHQQPQAPAAPKTPPPVAPSSAPSSALASALETPLMFSRCTSLSSLDSFGSPSIASSLPSEPCSGGASGVVSPSDLPDSPGQTMPPSRNKTPPPPAASLKPPASDPPAATACLARAQRDHAGARGPASGGKREEEEEDFLLHFATESTPHGFSRASSLSALSVDEPFIPRQPAAQDLGQERSAPVTMVTSAPDRGLEATAGGDEVDAVVGDDDDDDISILEACIHLAMPTRSSRRPKKPVTSATGGAPPPPQPPQGSEAQMAGSPGSLITTASRKPSLLPVYKLHPQQHRPRPLEEETPRVYCVEDTPLSFSTATSLSDLTIDSPPTEVAPGNHKDRRHAPIAVATREEEQEVKEEASKVPDDEENEDILAECISAAMPKPRPQRNLPQPQRHAPPADANAANTATAANAAVSSLAQRESELRPKPTSPVKPMVAQRPAPPPPSQPAGGQRRRFAYDSPHHYTPIEGTPCCFSRNDSLSSLDFDDEEEGPEGAGDRRRPPEPAGRLSVPEAQQKPAQQKPAPPAAAVLPRSKEGAEPPPSGAAPDDGRQQRFAVEDTPVCFSRNSSLSSLSDIMDQENNNVASPPSPPPPPQEPPAPAGPQPPPQALVPAPQAPPQAAPPNGQLANPGRAGYAPRAFAVEDTPVCFSRNSSLSSLSIDSEDDLLLECISSAMPKRKHLLPAPPPPAQPLPSTPPSHPVEEEEEGDMKDEEEEAFDWKAIQEGANSVVSSLNQAAVSDPPQDSSDEDSDSVLSLRSGLSLSLGSPFHRLPRPAATAALPEEEPAAEGRGGAAGEEEEEEEGVEEEEEEGVEDEPEDQEGPEEYAAPQQPAGLAGACPRGGARVLRPGERSTLEEKRRKEEEERSTALKGGKKVYRSLLTGRPRPQTDATPPAPRPRPQSDTPPPAPRPRPQTETAPRPRPQSDTPPAAMATPSPRGRALKAPGAGLPPPRLSTKTPPSRRAEPGEGGRGRGASSSRSGSRDSTPSRRPAPLTSSSSSSTSSSSKSPGAAPPTSRLSCPSPGRPAKQAPPPGPPIRKSNSGGRSTVVAAAAPSGEGVERPALVRQSTFIKEAPSSAPGRKRSEEAPPPAPDTQSSSTRPAPSSRSTVSSSSSSSSLNNNQNPNRSHSESPSPSPRLSRTGTWKREGGGRRAEVEGGQHGSSLPRVGTWKRAGSSSSLLSASSSSSRGDQEEARGTWRKAKEQQEEVWVRMEDCPVNSPRPSSSSSSSSNAPPVISAPSPPKTSVTMTTASRPSPNANLNLRSRSRDSLDAPPPTAAPGRTGPFERAGPGKAYLGGGGGGAGGGGGGTVAARVSPFNYVPSPRKSSADSSTPTSSHAPSSSSTRPSLIPSPVAVSTAGGGKKRPQQTPPSPSPSKGDGSERGSYIVTSV